VTPEERLGHMKPDPYAQAAWKVIMEYVSEQAEEELKRKYLYELLQEQKSRGSIHPVDESS